MQVSSKPVGINDLIDLGTRLHEVLLWSLFYL